jgi:hypothetical protein
MDDRGKAALQPTSGRWRGSLSKSMHFVGSDNHGPGRRGRGGWDDEPPVRRTVWSNAEPRPEAVEVNPDDITPKQDASPDAVNATRHSRGVSSRNKKSDAAQRYRNKPLPKAPPQEDDIETPHHQHSDPPLQDVYSDINRPTRSPRIHAAT